MSHIPYYGQDEAPLVTATKEKLLWDFTDAFNAYCKTLTAMFGVFYVVDLK